MHIISIAFVSFTAGIVLSSSIDYLATPTVEETAMWTARKEQDRAESREEFQRELEMFRVAAPLMGCMK
jgi:hypothetical protein